MSKSEEEHLCNYFVQKVEKTALIIQEYWKGLLGTMEWLKSIINGIHEERFKKLFVKHLQEIKIIATKLQLELM